MHHTEAEGLSNGIADCDAANATVHEKMEPPRCVRKGCQNFGNEANDGLCNSCASGKAVVVDTERVTEEMAVLSHTEPNDPGRLAGVVLVTPCVSILTTGKRAISNVCAGTHNQGGEEAVGLPVLRADSP